MRRTIWRRLGAVVLALALVLGAVPSALAADEARTRGEALETLLAAAEGYREDLDAARTQLMDILSTWTPAPCSWATRAARGSPTPSPAWRPC